MPTNIQKLAEQLASLDSFAATASQSKRLLTTMNPELISG